MRSLKLEISRMTRPLNNNINNIPLKRNIVNIYKAFLDKVVDGDILNVTFDLGFGVMHKEIIRLSNINAPEKKSDLSLKATRALKGSLKNVPFLIIKTNKTDIYGRYVGDVFLAKKNQKQRPEDLQEVANNGIYLSKLLFKKGFVDLLA